MKRILIYIIFYAYVIALVKPYAPVITDLMAHTFYALEHVSTVHQHNGIYHVEKEIARAAQDLPENESVVNMNNAVAPHLATVFFFTPLIRQSLLFLFTAPEKLHSSAFLFCHFPPPKILPDLLYPFEL